MRLFILSIIAAICVLPQTATAQWITGHWSAGNSRESIANIPWSKITHLNYFAAGLSSSGAVVAAYTSQPELANLVSAAHANGVKIMIVLADGTGNAFEPAAGPSLVSTTASNIANYVVSNNFDGVDLDWEMSINTTDYRALVSHIRSALPAGKLIAIDGVNGSPNPIVTMAANQASNLDQINVMCYDGDNIYLNGGPKPWYNDAVLNGSVGTTYGGTCQWRMDTFTSLGVPAAKLGMGIPFYGRRWTGATAVNQGSGSISATIFYGDLVRDATRWQPANQHYDTTYLSNYLSIPSLSEFDSYNGIESMRDIASYVKSKGYGGYMIFTLEYEYVSGASGDARYPLSTELFGQVFGTATNTAPVITSTSPLGAAIVGASYSQYLSATGSPPITWGVTAGTLPAGLSLNSSSGLISGTPTTAATSTFTVQATNAFGNNSKSLSLTVTAAPPTISSFTASPSSVSAGGSSTLSWSTSGASVLQIDQGIGTVTGTSKSVIPTGTTTYKLTATNSGGSVSATATVTVTIGGTVAPPQTPAVPNVPTDSDLLVAADHCDTTLSADITNSTLSVPVASLSTCVPNQVLFIDSEQAKNCSGASNVFTICSSGRGFAGTAAATHKQGARVRGRIGAVYHNQIVQEYIALQTWLAGQTHHGTYPGGTSIGGACWPNHICTVDELYAASDFAESTLSAGIGAGDTSLTVAAASSFQASETILIGQELMKVGSVSGTTLSGLTRGIAGSTAAQHATGSSVIGVIAAFEFERLKLELHAMEADIYGTAGSTQGICGTSCTAVPGVSWPNHVFVSSEAGTAVNGGPFPALWRNRLKDEIKAFSADLSAHP